MLIEFVGELILDQTTEKALAVARGTFCGAPSDGCSTAGTPQSDRMSHHDTPSWAPSYGPMSF